MRRRRNAYNFFTIFTFAFLLLTNSSLYLCPICAMIFKSGVCAGNLLIWHHLHQAEFIELPAICGMDSFHSEKSHLHPNQVSNCPSSTRCLFIVQVTDNFNQNFLNHHFFIYTQNISQILPPDLIVFAL